MKLIRNLMDLFEGKENQESPLMEDLGNLNKISKDLLKAFQKRDTVYARDKDGNPKYGIGNSHQTTTFATNRIGRNSDIEVQEVKTVAKAMEMLERKEVLGFVIEADGEQVLSVAAIGAQKKKFHYERTYHLGIDMGWFAENDTDHSIAKEMDNKFHTDYRPSTRGRWGREEARRREERWQAPEDIRIVSDNSKAAVNFAVAQVAKVAKKAAMELSALVIVEDADRVQKHNDRERSRSGMLPRIRTKDGFAFAARKAREELRKRLDVYKAAKSKQFDSLDELLQHFVSDGYLDKFKFGGQVYKRTRHRIDLEYLWNGSDRHRKNENYIQYERQHNTPEYDQWEKQYIQLRKEWQQLCDQYGRESEQANQFYKDMTESRPPEYLNVRFKLQGGMIVPDEIEPSGDYW